MQKQNMILSVFQMVWSYLWLLNNNTKRLFKQNPSILLGFAPITNAQEEKFTNQLMSDGGQESGGDRDDDGSGFDAGGKYARRQKLGLIIGPILFVTIMLAPNPDGLSVAGQAVGATTAWVATWWMTEPIPIPATSLIPVGLFPATGALSPEEAMAPFADTIIFLLLGGFFIAVSIERWGLHRRIALRIINAIGTSPRRIILGFMIATGGLSMWISNTASAVVMMPIGLAVIHQTSDLIQKSELEVPLGQGEYRFGTALMLCIGYSAVVGGLGTPIGSPANLVAVGAIESLFGYNIPFVQWMLYGIPISIVGLAIVYIYMTRVYIPPAIDEFPAGSDVIATQLEQLGSMSREERLVLIVFSVTAAAWISREFVITPFLPGVDDGVVAILGALLLFLIPAEDEDGDMTFLIDWSTGLQIPWGILLLLGSGLSIADAFTETGLAEWIGEWILVAEGLPILFVFVVVVGLTVFLTELTSNTATAAMLMPILGSVAVGFGIHPIGLMLAGITAASFAFMLPVSSPPNAVVFGSGYITMPQMVKAGFGLNLIGIVLVILIVFTWLPLAWGIDITTLPDWAV